MKDKQQALTLAKELQEYTRVVGSRNQKINQTADQLVECLGSPSLTDDQQVVLEWLKKSCNADDYTTPMLAIYKLYSSQQMAPNLVFLTTEQQFQVLAAFANYGLEGEG